MWEILGGNGGRRVTVKCWGCNSSGVGILFGMGVWVKRSFVVVQGRVVIADFEFGVFFFRLWWFMGHR